MVRLLSTLRTSLLLSAILASALTTSADAKSSRKKGRISKPKSAKIEKEPARPAALSLTSQIDAPFSTVVLDAGHGGHDPGGIPSNLIPEKNVALDVVKRIGTRLESAGIRVVMTRSDDTFISLPERVSITNSAKEAIFVSVHFNSGARLGARGIETYYASPAAAPLAYRIQSNLMSTTTGENRGVKRASFYVLRNANVRAVLAECGFLTNPEDTALAQDANYREKLAAQIAGAIIEYHRSVSRSKTNTASEPVKSAGSAS